MEHKYQRVMREVCGSPWAILPAKLAAIRTLLTLRADGYKVSAEEVQEVMEANRPGERVMFAQGSAIAVIPVIGAIVPRGGMLLESSGAVSVQRITSQFRAALTDPDIAGILFDIDSPGGQVSGIAELSREIFEARGQKPIRAIANGLAASAAYWLASAADELVVTPSGEVGSIGVFAIHQNIAEALKSDGVEVTLISAGQYKTEGNPFEPLSEEALAAAQNRVDEFYAMFTEAVARNRGVNLDTAVNGFGQGRVVGATMAVSQGMADRVGTIDEVVQDLSTSGADTRADDTDFRLRRLRANSR